MVFHMFAPGSDILYFSDLLNLLFIFYLLIIYLFFAVILSPLYKDGKLVAFIMVSCFSARAVL